MAVSDDVTLPDWEARTPATTSGGAPGTPAGGAEAFRDALRRSLRPILVLMLVGLIAVNVLQQVRGARYAATAHVLVSPSQLSQILTGTQPAFVDPQRVQSTAAALADSPAVYREAARDRSLGSPAQLQDATSVSSSTSDDLLEFTTTESDRRRAVEVVNAVAGAYTRYRGTIQDTSVREAIARVQQAITQAGPADQPDLQRQLRRLKTLETLSTSDATVVDGASTAEKTSPRPLRDSIVGLSLGLVIALIAVAVREAIDTKVRNDAVVEEVLAAPIVGSIGSLPRGTRLVRDGRREAGFADAYGLLAAQLTMLTSDKRRRTPVVAITSALPGEGKTTTAANVAVALARRGQRVLLADFDFRKASLGDVFDAPAEVPGALQVMRGARSLEDAVWTVPVEEIWPHGSEDLRHHSHLDGSLRLLPAGGPVGLENTGQPAELAWLMRQMRSLADIVIVDTPAALLTVEMAEISRLVDRILVVVRQGRITQRSLRALARQMNGWEAEVAGVVMTDTPVSGDRYAAYGGYASYGD
jgi:polysaccharide biosynthesis transport protein